MARFLFSLRTARGLDATEAPRCAFYRFISPTRKRAEGRAPVRGFEFTSKDPTLQGGDPAETAPGLNNAKFSILVVVVMVVVMSYSLLGPMPFSNLLNL